MCRPALAFVLAIVMAAPAIARTQETVCITKTGGKYHRLGCRYLSRSQIAVTLEKARALGKTPCSVCNP
jgi:hypothetical protein